MQRATRKEKITKRTHLPLPLQAIPKAREVTTGCPAAILSRSAGSRRADALYERGRTCKMNPMRSVWPKAPMPFACLILAGSILYAQSGPTPATPDHPPNVPRTRIVMLGTGTPNADPERSGPATAVVVDDTAYLVDCGPGVVRRAGAANRKGVAALDPAKLGHVFVTHLHSDHTVGFADLIFTPWVLGREKPLIAYGPPGLKKMTEHLLQAYEEDIDMRIHGLEHANPGGYKVEVHEIEEGVIFKDERVTVRAFAVTHGSWKHAFGYRFDGPDRSIVVSGDTGPSPNLVENAKGADVLIHEVYSSAGFPKRPAGWQRYHAAFHTSTRELARIAEQTKPGLLILTHQLTWGESFESLIPEIREFYSGPVVSAKDLDVY